jgi:N-methylhydantoinase A
VRAYRVAEILDAPQLIVPLGAGVTSTVGFLAAPLAFDFVRTYYGGLERLDWAHVNGLLAEMESEGRAILTDAGVPRDEVRVTRTVEMRYVGQGHEIRVPLPDGDLGEDSVTELETAFETVYRRLYERIAHGNPLEALSWRMIVSGPRPALPLERLGQREGGVTQALDAIKSQRAIYLPEDHAFVEVPVFDRYQLRPGARFGGPAIVEERESTLVLGRNARARVDEYLNVVVDLREV